MSPRLPLLPLRSWFLASVLTVLAVLIVTYATHIYGTLSDLIIRGFDRKLLAVATTTAAFIDPVDHARLVDPLPLGGLTRDPVDGSIWAFDVHQDEFLKIRATDGFAVLTDLKLPDGFNNVASGIEPDSLIVLDGATGELRQLSTLTGKTTPSYRLEPPITGLATDNARGWLYASGRHLERLDLRSGSRVRVAELAAPYRDISFDSRHQTLWALDERGTTLLDLDPADGRVRRRVPLVAAPPAGTPAAAKPAPVELVAFVYDPVTDRMIGTARSLVLVDPTSGIVSTHDFLPGFGREQGPVYQRYAAPMRRIINRTNLTFLYTQVVTDRDRILYGLDGTVGEKHSPLLTSDVLPPDEVAEVQRLMTEGTTVIAPVRAWENWGLLKSAIVPLFDGLGRPVAMAGADVDITTIRYATRRALVITFAFGALLLLLTGMLSYGLSHRLTQPIARIKAAALRAAAGDYAQQIEIARPHELQHLARRFTTVTATLGSRFAELRGSVSAGRAARDQRALLARLAVFPPLAASAPAGTPWAWGPRPPVPPSPAAGGAIVHGAVALAWLDRPDEGDPLRIAARRAELAVTVHALLARHGTDPAALAPLLGLLAPVEVDAWVLLTTDRVHVLARRPGLVHRLSSGTAPVALAPASFATVLTAARGEAIVMGAAIPATLPPVPAASAAATLAAWRRTAADDASYAVVFQPAA